MGDRSKTEEEGMFVFSCSIWIITGMFIGRFMEFVSNLDVFIDGSTEFSSNISFPKSCSGPYGLHSKGTEGLFVFSNETVGLCTKEESIGWGKTYNQINRAHPAIARVYVQSELSVGALCYVCRQRVSRRSDS
jgi:hypothetical protein